ncbi:MAG: fibronectin type III domain-containing protein [Bacteroidales bacterium]|jgi:hypothetical protein|nr:fibronectin type III domain-containing protein [Bacteroidales bacterium]
MKKFNYRLLAAIIFIILQTGLQDMNAQITSLPYNIDFEDASRFFSEWLTEDDAMQYWEVGDYVAYEGDQSVYITYWDDNDYSSMWGPNSFFYQTVLVPSGGMIIEFDYKVGGIANEDRLRVGLFPQGTVPDYYDGIYGSYLEEYCCTPNNWQHARIIIPANQAGNKVLVFAWTNESYEGDEEQPAAAIDNLSITANECLVPVGLQAITSSITVNGAEISWTNPNSSDDVKIAYKVSTEENWNEFEHNGNSYTFSQLSQNTIYNVKVKSVCSVSESSEYTSTITFTTAASCQVPQNLLATAFDDYVSLSWEQGEDLNNTFIISYSIFEQNNWTDIPFVGTNTDINSLMPGTKYEVKVKSICGSENESSYISTTFTTTCSAYIEQLPFSESFDGVYFPPRCWDYKKISGSTDNIQWIRTTENTNSGSGAALFNSRNIDENHSAVLITPKVNLSSAERKKLVFSVYRYDGYGNPIFEGVDVFINDMPDMEDAEELISIPRVPWMEPEEDTDGWYEYIVDLSETELDEAYILFKGISEYYDNVIIDDIRIIESTLYTLPAIDDFSCSNERYYFYGTLLTESGEYTHTIITNNSTDTLVTLNFTIREIREGSFEAYTCEGVPYIWEGEQYTTGGHHERTFEGTNGCDSVVTMNLIITTPHEPVDFNHYICEGESYTWEGTDYTTTIVDTKTLEDMYGCDSIVTMNLTVNTIPEAPVITREDENNVIFLQSDIEENIKWYKNNILIDGATSSRYEISEIGRYHATTSNDCGESEASNKIDIEHINVPENITENISIYPNPAYDNITLSSSSKLIEKINIISPEGKLLTEKEVCNYSVTLDVNNLSNGLYIINYWIEGHSYSSKINISK